MDGPLSCHTETCTLLQKDRCFWRFAFLTVSTQRGLQAAREDVSLGRGAGAPALSIRDPPVPPSPRQPSEEGGCAQRERRNRRAEIRGTGGLPPRPRRSLFRWPSSVHLEDDRKGGGTRAAPRGALWGSDGLEGGREGWACGGDLQGAARPASWHSPCTKRVPRDTQSLAVPPSGRSSR